jgi:hypothetical protein
LIVAGGFVLLLSSGCATTPEPVEPATVETLKEACDLAISDPDRSAKVLALLRETTQIMVDRAEYLKAHNEEFKKLTSNYSSTEDEIRNLIGEYNEVRTSAQDRIIEITGQIRELVTDEEWKKLDEIRTQQVQALMDGARWL